MSNKSDCSYCGGHIEHHNADSTHCHRCWTCDDCQMHGCDANYNELHHDNVKSSKGSKRKKNAANERWLQEAKELEKLNKASFKSPNAFHRYATTLHETLGGTTVPPSKLRSSAEMATEAVSRWNVTDDDIASQKIATPPGYGTWSEVMHKKAMEQEDAKIAKLTSAIVAASKNNKKLKEPRPQDNPDRNVRSVNTYIAPAHCESVGDDGCAISLYSLKAPKNYRAIPSTVQGNIIINGKGYHHFYARNDGSELVIESKDSSPGEPKAIIGKIYQVESDNIAMVIGWSGIDPPKHKLSIQYDVVENASKFPGDDGNHIQQQAGFAGTQGPIIPNGDAGATGIVGSVGLTSRGDKNTDEKPKQKNHTWEIFFPGGSSESIFIQTNDKKIGQAMKEMISILGAKKASQSIGIYLQASPF